VWIADCSPEKFSVLTWAEWMLKHGGLSGILVPMESVQSEGVHFQGLNSSGIKNHKRENTNTEKFHVPKMYFIHPICCSKKVSLRQTDGASAFMANPAKIFLRGSLITMQNLVISHNVCAHVGGPINFADSWALLSWDGA